MRLIGAILISVAVSTTAAAHHSTRAFYDRDASMEIEGTVTSVFWRNPHVGLTLLVRNEQGAEEEWKLEGGAMNSLQRRGFTGDSVAVGDYVRVAGAPSTRGQKAVFVTNFLLPTGKEVIFTDTPQPLLWTKADDNSSDTRVTSGTHVVGQEPVADIFRVWSRGEGYRLKAPLKLTAAANAARSSWDPTTDDLALRCEAPGMPNAILNPYPIELIDEGRQIRLKIEEWDSVRLIHLSDAELPEDEITPDRLGYSRGSWDGDTLIVSTTAVSAPYLDDSGTPMSEDVQMVERFTLHRDEGRLDYEVTVTDPENLAEPAVWIAAWIWNPGTRVRPFECTTR